MNSVEAAAAKHCDEKCQKRAKAGEVVIVSIVLVIALISGRNDNTLLLLPSPYPPSLSFSLLCSMTHSRTQTYVSLSLAPCIHQVFLVFLVWERRPSSRHLEGEEVQSRKVETLQTHRIWHAVACRKGYRAGRDLIVTNQMRQRRARQELTQARGATWQLHAVLSELCARRD